MTAEGGGLLAMAGAATFWRGVDASRGLLGCWPWRGSRDRQGYGRLVVVVAGRRRWIRAHRVALAIALGRELAPDELALHRCNWPACCNPGHLYAGTAADNARDREAARRRKRLGQRPRSANVIELAELCQPFDSSHEPAKTDARKAPSEGLTRELGNGRGSRFAFGSVTLEPGQSRSRRSTVGRSECSPFFTRPTIGSAGARAPRAAGGATTTATPPNRGPLEKSLGDDGGGAGEPGRETVVRTPIRCR